MLAMRTLVGILCLRVVQAVVREHCDEPIVREGGAGCNVPASSLLQFSTSAHVRKSSLCTPIDVRQSCGPMTSWSHEDAANVSKALVQQKLAANATSLDALWTELGLESSVSCMTLCLAVVRALENITSLPPKTGVACIPRQDGKTDCNISLGEKEVAKHSRFKGDLPDFHDRAIMRNASASFPAKRTDAERIEYSRLMLLRRIANLFFRIYPPTNTTEGPDAWRGRQHQLKLFAMSYVDMALRRFDQRRTKRSITTWFGVNAYTDENVRRGVRFVLSSISTTLESVVFVANGTYCTESTYAYVFQGARTCANSELKTRSCTRNDKNQVVFYLCPLHMNSEESVQIETLIHEASHHAVALTTDVKIRDTVMYGRERCKNLAKDHPDEALRNADNFCYYINDIQENLLPGS